MPQPDEARSAARAYEMTQAELDRLARIRSTVAGELDGSVWYVDGERIEAADREYWLDQQWLLDLLDAADACIVEARS